MLSLLRKLLSPPPRRAPRRAAGHRDPGPTTLLQPDSEADWKRSRSPERDQDRQLSSASKAWLHTLPEPVRPLALCVRHPRLVNRICLCWGDPELTARLFDDLLVDRRGQRRGFAPAIASELLLLRMHHAREFAVDPLPSMWELDSVAQSDRD